jgi:hypothetical protein
VNDLLDLLERLIRHRVEFVLVGGQAAIVHGATLVTRDLDICMEFTPDNLARLESALADLHPVHRMTPRKIASRLADIDQRSIKNLYLQTDYGVLDCLSEIAGVGKFVTVAERSVAIDLPIGRCRVLSLSALIDAKTAMNRIQDKLALIQLKAILDKTRSESPER